MNYDIFATVKRLLILLFVVFSYSAKAQYSMDFGLNLGGSTYIGEVSNGGSEGFQAWPINTEWSKINMAVGGFYRYNFTHRIGAKVSFNFARIAGADSLSDDPTRIARNLSFRTDIFEIALLGEYNFLIKRDLSRRARIDFQAGAVAGIGYSLFFPYAQIVDEWFALRPLATEGPDNAYDEATLVVPLGVNAAFTFNKKLRLGMEFVYRLTFTDYLDDVSTRFADPADLESADAVYFSNRSAEAFERGNADLPDPGFYKAGSRRGNPETNDGYFMMQFNLSYVIFTNRFYQAKYNSVINRRRKRTKF